MNARFGSVDDLVSHVQRRTEQRAVALEAAGEKRAHEIEEKGADQAEATRRAIVDAGRSAAAEARRQRLSAAELERRHRRLKAREDRLERVWDAASDDLAALGGDGIPVETLARLAQDAARRLGGSSVEVQLDKASLATVDADVVAGWSPEGGPALSLNPEPLPRGHGMIVRSGRASVDATLEGRLDQARSALRAEIDALLSRAEDGDAA